MGWSCRGALLVAICLLFIPLPKASGAEPLYVSRTNSSIDTYGSNHPYQVERWDIANGQSLGLLNLPAGEYQDMTFAGPSADLFINQEWDSPTHIAGSRIAQCDRVTGSLLRSFGADAPILGMATSPNGILYVSRSDSATSDFGSNHPYQVERWNPANGQSLGLLNLPMGNEYRDLTFGGPTSDLFINQTWVSPTSNAGSIIAEYDRNTGSLIRTFGPDSPILGMAISPDGVLYVSRSNASTSTFGSNHPYQVERWNPATGQSLGLLNLPAGEYREMVFAGPSNDLFINQEWASPTHFSGSLIGQYNRNTGALIRTFGADAPILGMGTVIPEPGTGIGVLSLFSFLMVSDGVIEV